MFTVGGDDVAVFFPVEVSFVGQGSLAGVSVDNVQKIWEEEGGEVKWSVDKLVGCLRVNFADAGVEFDLCTRVEYFISMNCEL